MSDRLALDVHLIESSVIHSEDYVFYSYSESIIHRAYPRGRMKRPKRVCFAGSPSHLPRYAASLITPTFHTLSLELLPPMMLFLRVPPPTPPLFVGLPRLAC